MFASTKIFVTMLENQEIKYTYRYEESHFHDTVKTTRTITPSYSCEYHRELDCDVLTLELRSQHVAPLFVLFYFDEDCRSVMVRVTLLQNVSETRTDQMLRILNCLNATQEFFKFFLFKGTVLASYRAVFDTVDMGFTCIDLLQHTVDMVDAVYFDLHSI